MTVEIVINGDKFAETVPALRWGCDTTQCGACAIELDGVAVKSCAVLAAQAEGGPG